MSEIKGLLPDRALSDPTLPTAQLAVSLNGPSQTINVPDPAGPSDSPGCFVVSACEQTGLSIVNSSSDPDPVGYFNLGVNGQPAAEDTSAAPQIEPPLTFDPNLAYLILNGVSVTFKASGTLAIGSPATLGLDGSLTLDAGVCVGFPRATMVSAALGALAGGIRTIFSPDDLLSAEPPSPAAAQVLSFGAQGALNLSLKLTASSLTSTLADSINAVLATTGVLNFAASPSLSLTVCVGASDGYRVFAQRLVGSTLFSVKKSLSTSLGVSAAAGLTVTISSADLDALVDSAIDQWSGNAEGTLQTLLASASASALAAADQQKLSTLLAKLKLPTTGDAVVQALQSKIADLKADLSNRLTALVCAQFAYSWQRLTTQSLVARFTVPDAVLPKYHSEIMRLDLSRVLADGPADGVGVLRVLGRSDREIDVGYGFSFGVAGYTFFKSWDSLALKFVELDCMGGAQGTLRQYSFLGKRGYVATWLKTSQENYVELDAATTAPTASPDTGDFQVRLSVAFTWKSCAFKDIVNEVVDHGAVIDVFDTGDVPTAVQELVDRGLSLDATGDATVSLVLSDTALQELLPVLLQANFATYIAPNAMARALFYYNPYPERTNADRRSNVYTQVFADFLALDDPSQVPVARLCASQLGRLGADISTGLAEAEGGEDLPWTAQDIVADADPDDLQDAVKNKLPRFFSLLAARTGDFRSVFPQCVSNFSDLAAQRYGCRVLAGILVVAAVLKPSCLAGLSRTVQFNWVDGNKVSHTLVAKAQS